MDTQENNTDDFMDELQPSSTMDLDAIQQAVRTMLVAFGENPERKGLARTPERVARMYTELLAGYMVDPKSILNDALIRCLL